MRRSAGSGRLRGRPWTPRSTDSGRLHDDRSRNARRGAAQARRGDDRRRERPRAAGLDAPRRIAQAGRRDADALLRPDAPPGERVPRLRRRARGLAHARPVVLELLGSSVDLSLAQDAQRYIAEYGARLDRFGPDAATVAQPAKVDNELYVRDYSRCILCYKCVEACGEDHQNTFAIAIAGRGFDARVSTELDVPLPDSACVYCGNCIAVCPTGALQAKTEWDMRAAGTWNEERQTQVDTTCPYCGVGCTLTLHVQDDRIVKATSPLDHDVTRGNLCIKGRFGWEFVGGEGR